MKQEFSKEPTVVVYKKSNRSNKHYMLVTEKHVDIVNNANARKPVIDNKYEFVELGVGQSFIEKWMKRYNIKKYEFV